VLGVNIEQTADTMNYSVVVEDGPSLAAEGLGKTQLLLSPGRHSVEIRDGDVVVRRGVFESVAGGWAVSSLIAASRCFRCRHRNPSHALDWLWKQGGSLHSPVRATARR